MSQSTVSQGGVPPQTSERLVVGVVDDPAFDQHAHRHRTRSARNGFSRPAAPYRGPVLPFGP